MWATYSTCVTLAKWNTHCFIPLHVNELKTSFAYRDRERGRHISAPFPRTVESRREITKVRWRAGGRASKISSYLRVQNTYTAVSHSRFVRPSFPIHASVIPDSRVSCIIWRFHFCVFLSENSSVGVSENMSTSAGLDLKHWLFQHLCMELIQGRSYMWAQSVTSRNYSVNSFRPITCDMQMFRRRQRGTWAVLAVEIAWLS